MAGRGLNREKPSHKRHDLNRVEEFIQGAWEAIVVGFTQGIHLVDLCLQKFAQAAEKLDDCFNGRTER